MVNHDSLNMEKIISALITPMDINEQINYSALEELVEQQLKSGVEGFYCCGSSGEGLLLTMDERKAVTDHVLKKAGGKVPVIAHIGTIRTFDVIELAKHAKNAGVDAVSMIPPYYYHFSKDEITEYYEAIIKAVPDMKVIIYNIPQFTGIEFDKKNAERLLKNPNIAGVKHTSQNLFNLERIKTAYPEKILFNGFDEQFLGSLAMGATATIGTTVNLFPEKFLKIRSLFQQGKLSQALEEQHLVNQSVEKMIQTGIFNAVKYGWTKRGIECGSCRSPFKPLNDTDKLILDELFS